MDARGPDPRVRGRHSRLALAAGAALLAGAAIGGAAMTSGRGAAVPSPERAPSAQARAALPPLAEPRIVIAKGVRRLELHDGARLVRTYRIALGAEPSGTKRREGDRRTPEGAYYVCTKNARSRYTRSLGISYPGVEDAEQGLRDGVIDRVQYEAILRANAAGTRPPWDTPLGGEIMIHGNGADRDWTLGCVALDDADILELFTALPLGTPVEIGP